MNNSENISNKEKDVRLQATIWMWGLSIPLFCCCVPIIALTTMGILLPIFVLTALAIGTASIWFFSSNLSSAVKVEIKQLQERVIDLEAIVSHDEINKKFESLQQTDFEDFSEVTMLQKNSLSADFTGQTSE